MRKFKVNDPTGLVSTPTITMTQPLSDTPSPTQSTDPLPGISLATYTWVIFVGSILLLALQAFPSAGIVSQNSHIVSWVKYLAVVLTGANGILAHMAKQSAVDFGRKLAKLNK